MPHRFINVPKSAAVPIGNMNPLQAAGLTNPGFSSWMALKKHVDWNIAPNNFTVLILGATSASGTLAITLARDLGATNVIGLARNLKALDALGLDDSVELKPTDTYFSNIGDVDVMLDYLYGNATEQLFKYLASAQLSRPLQYVQISSLAGLDITLPGKFCSHTRIRQYT